VFQNRHHFWFKPGRTNGLLFLIKNTQPSPSLVSSAAEMMPPPPPPPLLFFCAAFQEPLHGKKLRDGVVRIAASCPGSMAKGKAITVINSIL
jgi:hypothetical protein